MLHTCNFPSIFIKFLDLMLIFDREKIIDPYLGNSSGGCMLSSHKVPIEYTTNQWLKLVIPREVYRA